MRSRIRRSALAVVALSLGLAACGTPEAAVKVTPEKVEEIAPKKEPVVEASSTAAETVTPSFYALSARSLEGESVDLASYAGQVSLVVNVASKCGYTPQYTGLQQLHEELAALGVNVLAFPSNDFGGQEPGSAEQIREFCTNTYGVSFPIFEKVVTQAGGEQSPIYGFLGEQTGELPNWNFCKYLIGRDGKPLAFFTSSVAPDSSELRAAIMEAL